MHKQMTDKSRLLWMKGKERGEPCPSDLLSLAMVAPEGFFKSLILWEHLTPARSGKLANA